MLEHLLLPELGLLGSRRNWWIAVFCVCGVRLALGGLIQVGMLWPVGLGFGEWISFFFSNGSPGLSFSHGDLRLAKPI